MKLRPLLLLVILLCTITAQAQLKTKKASVIWGPETKESKKLSLGDVIGYDESGTYILKTKRKGFSKSDLLFEHLDNKLVKTKTTEVELETAGKKRGYEYTIHSNGKLYLFSSSINKKVKKNTFYYQELNKKTLLPNSKPIELGIIDYSGSSNYNSGSFSLRISRNKERILIYHRLPYEKGKSEKVGFLVLDKDMNKIWERQVTLPYSTELFDVERYRVDEKGNVYLLGLAFKDKRKLKRKGDPNYKYMVLAYTNKGETLDKFPVELPGKFITDMQIAIADNGDIICGGFYSEEGTFSVKGSYYISIDGKTKAIKTNNSMEFGIDFVTQNLKPNKAKKAKKKAEKGKNIELYEYDLDEIILKDGGGAVLVSEQFYIRVVTRTSTDANGNTHTTTTYYYYYNDIIVININGKGEIVWTEKIPKRQATSNDGGYYSSYALAIKDDKMFFIFNDNAENLFYKPGGTLKNFSRGKNGIAVLVTLTEEGRYSREKLFSVEEAEVLIRPKVCEQTSDDQMLLFGQRKKSHRYGMLTFK